MSRFRWRCTNIGTLVVAIKLEHDDDPTWYNGPPYKIVEHVIDEYGLMARSLRLGEGNS